jgi:GntR family transcriptional regulator
VRLVRRDSLRGRPVAAAECVLPERLLGAVSAEDLAGRSTYELLEERGVPIASARQVLRAEPAAAKAAGLLGVVEGSPLLVLDRLTFDAAGAPVEVGRVSYPHDIAECVVELERTPGRRESPTGVVLNYPDTRRRSR